MNCQTMKWAGTCVLWTASLAFMIGGTFKQSVIIMAWGGFTALTACVLSGLIIAECAASKAAREERLRVETIGELIAAKGAGSEVPRIR